MMNPEELSKDDQLPYEEANFLPDMGQFKMFERLLRLEVGVRLPSKTPQRLHVPPMEIFSS